MNKLKLMILGYGRHGKDTVADYLKMNYGLTHVSSSMFVLHEAVYPVLQPKYGYKSEDECFNDRHNHRAEWYDAISNYNQPNRAALATKLFESYDMYVGLRNADELEACIHKGIFDYSIWVDATERLNKIEDASSCTISRDMCDFKLNNNNNLHNLYVQIDYMMSLLS